MILPSQLKLSNKHAQPSIAAASRGAHSTRHAVKPAINHDKGVPDVRPRASTGTSGAISSIDLQPSRSNTSNSHNELAAIAWESPGPIHPSKPPLSKQPPSKKPSRKASNPLPSAGGGELTATMDRTFTRRPASKESTTTTSSQRTGVSTISTPLAPITSSSLTNSSTSTSSNLPVLNLLPSTASAESMARPFTMRHNRKYLSDPQSYYPLPFTISENHRQVLRSQLLVSVFGSPLCSPLWAPPNPPPKKILEVGCGNGYWSALCHKHFASLGHSVEFTGIDIAPLAMDMKAKGMKWRFVQHDLRSVPIPFGDEEFDVIMVKDLALISSALNLTANLMEEYFRCLKPGGQMEVWDSDSCIRLLAPHSPSSPDTTRTDRGGEGGEAGEGGNDDLAQADGTGTYVITPQTPFKDAQNAYLLEYNAWITRALTKLGFTTMPCTLMGPLLAQEPQLGDVQTRRIAVPFCAKGMRWEREDEGENGRYLNREEGKRVLAEEQKALREMAALGFGMWCDSMEPFLKEAAGKNQEEWDRWYGDMMASLYSGGTAAGECLEIGAWWATKEGRVRGKKGNSAIAEARRRKEEAEGGGGRQTSYPKEPHPGQMWEFPEPGGGLL